MHDSKAFFKILKDKYGYKLKGVGNPEYHLGGDFGCDPDGTLYWSAKTYIDKMLKAYERMLVVHLVRDTAVQWKKMIF